MMELSVKETAMIRRRAPLVAIAAGLGLIGAFAVLTIQEPTYSARAVVTVPIFDSPADDGIDDAADDALGRPLDASRLARTYASLIIEDTSILGFVSEATGQPVDELTDVLSVENTPDTPLIEIVATGPDADIVDATLQSAVAAVAGPTPASPSIAPDSLRTVRVEEPEASTSTGVLPASLAGLILGSSVGIVVAIFWERSKPRIDLESEATTLLGMPSRDIRKLGGGFAVWVAKHWNELAGTDGWVQVIVCEPVTLSAMSEVEAKLGESLEVTRIDEAASASAWDPPDTNGTDDDDVDLPMTLAIGVPYGGSGAEPGRLVVRANYPPGRPGGVELGPVPPGLVVIAIARGAPAAEVAETIETLASAGFDPGYALVLD